MKKLQSIALFLLWTAFPASSSWAQDTGEGAQLLAAALDAHGGGRVAAAAGDLHSSGRLLTFTGAGQIVARLDVRTRGVDQLWLQSTSSEGTRLYVADGRGAWSVTGGVSRPVPASDGSNRPLELNPVAGFLAAFLQGRLKPLGGRQVVATVGERTGTFSRVDVEFERRDPLGRDPLDRTRPYRLLLDGETHRLSAVRIPLVSRDGRSSGEYEELVYGDYRQVGGVWMPHRIDRVSYGAVQSTIELDGWRPGGHGNLFVEP